MNTKALAMEIWDWIRQVSQRRPSLIFAYRKTIGRAPSSSDKTDELVATYRNSSAILSGERF